MDQILNIDNNETKKVGVSTESGGITGVIDFLSDNNSEKSNPTPMSSPKATPAEPKLGVTDTMGINLLGSSDDKKEEPKTVPEAPKEEDSFMMKPAEEEFKPIHRMSPTEIKRSKCLGKN